MLVGEIIVSGRKVPVPGVSVVTWQSDPARCPLVTKGARRDAAKVSAVVLHTSRGAVGKVVPGGGSGEKAAKLARYQARGDREASWHFTVGADGVVWQQADAGTFTAWHATQANGWSVGIECAQSADSPDLTQYQVDACVALVAALCDALGIPRRIPVNANGSVVNAPVRAWQSRKQGGESRAASGVIGHRNLTRNRGKGDPGDPLMLALLAAGFAGVTPDAMTVGAPAAPEAVEREDVPHDEDDDAPAWPPLPSWLDPALEVDASRDLPDDIGAFVRAQWPVLRDMGFAREQAAEFIAHAATECGRGRRAIAHNLGGVKAKEREYREAAAKGVALTWWRDLGHVESGDDEVEYYRGFTDDAEFWRYFAKRFAPRGAATTERYAAAGNVFWSDVPELWFPAIVRAGYRGGVRQREIAALADPETHPSVVAHRALAAKVRGLM